MSASQSGVFNIQEFQDMGTPLVGGRLYTYAYGTTTHKTAYTDHSGTVPHTYTSDGAGGQFIALDARGELPAPLYLAAGSYDLALKTAVGATVWTRRADPVWDITNDLSSTGGADLVGFIQSGTGASQITVQDALRDFVSITQFDGVPGSSDNTTPLLNAAATGKRVYIPSGEWRINLANLPPNTYLFGDGPNTIIKPLTDGIQFALGADSGSASAYVENITIRDIKFLGNVASLGFLEHSNLVNFNGVKDLLIERCHFVGFRGDGIFLGSGNIGGQERHNVGVTIRDCFFDGVNKDNRQSISVIDCDGLIIENNRFTRCTKSTMPGAIDVEPDANLFHVIRDIKILNNKFYDIGGNVGAISIFLTGVNFTTPPSGFLIEGNYVDTAAANGISFNHNMAGGITDSYADYDLKISGNTVRNANRPFSVINGKDVKINGNTFTQSNYEALIGYSADANVIDLKLSGNTFDNCGSVGGNGLMVFKTSRVDIDGNTFSDCGTGIPGAANAIDFNTGTSVDVSLRNNTFVAPTGKTLIAVQKEAGHTFTPATNSCYGNTLNGLSNSFQHSANPSAVPEYLAEGATFTPVLSGGSTAGAGTYSTQTGYFTQVGKLIHFQIELTWSAHTGTGQAVISLPGNINTNSVTYSPVVVLSSGITLAAGAQLVGLLFKDGNRIQLYTENAGALVAAGIATSGTLYISGSYLSA